MTAMSGMSSQIEALATTSNLMEKWNKECFLGSVSPIEVLKSLCEVGVLFRSVIVVHNSSLFTEV